MLLLCALFLFPFLTFAEGSAELYAPIEAPPTILSDDYGTAVVQKILHEEHSERGGFPTLQQRASMKFLDGAHEGEVFQLKHGVLANQEGGRLRAGDRVVIQRILRTDGEILYLFREPYRITAMIWLGIAFLLLSVLFGGLRGLSSVAGLVVSIVVLLFFVVPAIAGGKDPLLTSIFGAYSIACTSLYLAHGFNRRTSVALLSTLITLTMAGICAYAATYAASLFGTGSEESLYLITGQFGDVHLRGLLIGGFIIGALGVLDDVTTAQCATVDEISKANPSLSALELWRSGMSVGREHIASLVNTLALAYVGTSLPLLLLFQSSDRLPTWLVLNGEMIAEEVVRTLVGSTALLLAVPISTWLAVKFLRNKSGQVLPSCGHVHHH